MLTLAGLISKILGAIYRVPLQNLTGDVGFYLYQQVYPFIAFVMIVALYGFPAAIAKLTAEAIYDEKRLTFRTFFTPIFSILFVVSMICSFAFYFGAPTLAKLAGDARLTSSYRLFSSLFLFVPFISLLRGFFQGKGKMQYVALSQVTDQVVRVSFIVAIAYFVYIGVFPLERISDYSMLASLFGMICAIFLLVVLFRSELTYSKIKSNPRKIPWRTYIKTVVTYGIVASSIHFILIWMQLGDVISLVTRLQAYGYSFTTATELKGILDRGYPLIQFAIVFGSSFALALIPNFVIEKQGDNITKLTRTTQEAVMICTYIATAATLGLIILLPEVNMLLFKTNVEPLSLRLLMLTIIFASYSIIVGTLLQNSGYVFTTAIFIFGAFLCKIAFNYSLVPVLGTSGASLATVLSLFMLAVVVTYSLKRILRGANLFQLVKWRPFLLATLCMSIYLLLIKIVVVQLISLESRLFLLGIVSFYIASGAFIYIIVMLRYRALSSEQLQYFPFATKLVEFERKIRKST